MTLIQNKASVLGLQTDQAMAVTSDRQRVACFVTADVSVDLVWGERKHYLCGIDPGN